MHIVSNAWENNQKAQLRSATQIKATIFDTPFSIKKTESSNGTSLVKCANLLACIVKLGDYIDFTLKTPMTIDVSKLIFKKVKGNGRITLLDANATVLFQGSIGSLLSGTFNDVACIRLAYRISVQDLEIDYCYYGTPLYLTGNEIEKIEYKAHCSILNEDLPYHKITMKTFDSYFAVQTNTICFAEVGYNGEYIPLGCGYYYLDRKSYTENKTTQQYSFVDRLSTLTDRCRLQMAYYHSTMKGLAEALLDQSNNTYLDYFVAEKDISMLGSYYSGSSSLVAYNKTIAETLQLIAQSSALTLYINEKGIITFIDASTINETVDDNVNWILETPTTTKSDDIYKFKLNAMISTISRTSLNEAGVEVGDPIVLADFNASSGEIIAVDLDGSQQLYANENCINLYTSPNYVVVQQSGADNHIRIRSRRIMSAPTPNMTKEYVVNQHGTSNCELNLDLGYIDLDTIKNYYTFFLSRNSTLILNTRFDSKYMPLDKLQGDYGTFIIEDILASYGQGCRGKISGTATILPLQAPKLLSKSIINANDYSFKFFNPNDVGVELCVQTSSGVAFSITMQPLSTYEIDTDLDSQIQDYLLGGLADDVIAWFEESDSSLYYGTSDTVIVLEHNSDVDIKLMSSPQLEYVNITDASDYEIGIKNPNDWEVQLYIRYNNGTTFMVSNLFPKESIELYPYASLESEVQKYLDGELVYPIECYFKIYGKLYETPPTVIFQPNDPETLFKSPVLSDISLVSAGVFSFTVSNPNSFPIRLFLIKEKDGYILDQLDVRFLFQTSSATISSFTKSILLFLGDDVNNYLNNALDHNVKVRFVKDTEYRETILMEKNDD